MTLRLPLCVNLLLAASTVSVWAQQPDVNNKNLPEDAVVRTEEQWLRASHERDRKTLNELMPDDFMATTPIGEVLGKSKLVPADHPPQSLPQFKLVAPITHIYGDVAVLMGRLVDESGGELSTTSVFKRSGDGWKIIATQLTPLPK
jgi:ketosteroid isomerase-like protein